MTKNEEFLQYAYKNASMGKSSIDQIIKVIDDNNLKDVLHEQINDYEHILENVAKELEILKSEPKDVSKFTEMMTYFSVKISTVNDNTSTHIAKMLIKGSDMGIIQITETLSNYKRLKPSIRQIGKNLLEIEENNRSRLKKFL